MKMVDKTSTWLSIDRKSLLLKLSLRGCIIAYAIFITLIQTEKKYMRLSPQTFDSGAWTIYHVVLRNKSLSIHGEKTATKRDRKRDTDSRYRSNREICKVVEKKNVEIYMEHLEVVIKLLKNC